MSSKLAADWSFFSRNFNKRQFLIEDEDMNKFKKALYEANLADGEHHAQMAGAHLSAAACHGEETNKASDGRSYHQKMEAFHKSAAESHTKAAVAHLACARAFDTADDMQDDDLEVAQETRLGSSTLQQAMFGGDLTNPIVPDRVRAVFTTTDPSRKVTMVPRTGGPIGTDDDYLQNVPPQFLDLVKIDQD